MGGVCDGLEAVHRAGVVHRDVKGSNVLLGKEGPVLFDFGTAHVRPLCESESPDERLGSPKTMSPEYLVDGVCDGRSDLYALGCLMYEMLTGQPPFTGKAREIMKKHVMYVPSPIKELADHCPDRVDGLVARLLDKKPENRFQTAKETKEALQDLLASL